MLHVLDILCFAVGLRHFHIIVICKAELGVVHMLTKNKTTAIEPYYSILSNWLEWVALCNTANTAILLFKVTLFQVFVCKLTHAKGSGWAG